MTYLIHGATGAQGGPVSAALRASTTPFIAAVRHLKRFDGDAIAVDVTDASSLAAAYTGVEGVFVHLPIGAADAQKTAAHAIGEALASVRPPRVVLSTSGYPLANTDGAATPLGELISIIRGAGISLAVVEPRLFLENLLLPVVIGPARETGVLGYPVRTDYAISWSSHLDVADVVVRLLADPTVTGTVGVGALPGLIGDDLAAGFTEYLGRTIQFEAITPDEFGEQITPLFGPGAAPVVDSYRWRQTQPDELIVEETSAQRVLGLEPRTVAAWLHDLGV